MSANIIALGDDSAELMLLHSVGRPNPSGNASSQPTQPSRSGTVAPEPAQDGDAEALADESTAASGARVSDILSPTPHSMSENVYRTNVIPMVSATCTMGEVMLLFLAFEWIAGRLSLHMPSLYAFVSGLMIIIIIRVVREKDKVHVESFKVKFPVAVATSCCMLWLAEDGNTGAYTTPLVALMIVTYNAAGWPYEPRPRPNILKYYLQFFPVAIFLTFLLFLPKYAVALPGRLLANHPVAYTLWTGVGFPLFSFVVRKIALSYLINLARRNVESGRIAPEDSLTWISAASLNVSTTLLFGNIMLLYLADDVGYALLGSVASIFIEVGGKLYVIWSTEKSIKMYLGARGISRTVIAAQAEPGVNGAMRSNTSAGDGPPDERLSEVYWEDVRAMMALRWTNEIVCEKCCIIVGAFVTKVLIESPRTTEEQIVIMLVFLVTEFVADLLLVYCLDRWFAVPFRRMPLSGKLKSPEFCNDVKLTVLCIGCGSFIFKHAFDTALEWFPDAVDAAAAGGALGVNATSIALNATIPW
jgi:hypothetical protein